MQKRKVCVVVGSRANYGSIKSVMRAVQQHPDLDLQLVVAASALLDRYGSVVQIVEQDGFRPDARVHMLIEGETPLTMAKSTGMGLLELPTVFDNLQPDIVVTVGDRFETIATAIAAAYMNIPLAHTMGGEVTGTIDESVRHAVTKLAHIHFPANRLAGKNIVRMGEDPSTVHVVGCPRIDLVAEIATKGAERLLDDVDLDGVGAPLDLSQPYIMVIQHPVTTEYGQGQRQIEEVLAAVQALQMQTIIFWPNADAGSEDIARGIRIFRERNPKIDYVHVIKNLEVEIYTRLMIHAACLLGNTSSAIREGPFLGTPAVNIGTRQSGRERGANVIDVGYDRDEVVRAASSQIHHGRYPSDHVYGDGGAGKRIADILATGEFRIQKKLCY